MSVQDLDNQEKGLTLQQRAAQQAENDAKNSARTKAASERAKKSGASPEDELEGLRQRMEAARAMVAPKADRCNTECAQHWTNGRDAALKAIEG